MQLYNDCKIIIEAFNLHTITDEKLKGDLDNFRTEQDFNILGNIFESSLNNPVRKKEGVFYTPNAITNYIIKDTVDKLCDNKKQELCIDVDDYYYDNKRNKNYLLDKLEQLRTLKKNGLIERTPIKKAKPRI